MQSLTLENFQLQKLIQSETTTIKRSTLRHRSIALSAHFNLQSSWRNMNENPKVCTFLWVIREMAFLLFEEEQFALFSSYHLQSSISSLLLNIKDCFNTCATPLRIFQESELEIHFLNVCITSAHQQGFSLTHWLLSDCISLCQLSKTYTYRKCTLKTHHPAQLLHT